MYVHLQTKSILAITKQPTKICEFLNLAVIEPHSQESPGWIALCTDTDGFKDSTGSQLLHYPAGVIS